MNQNNSTDNVKETVNEELNNEPIVNSNNSDELNPHYYANENYNQHGAYDPNFNAGLSSYQPNPLNQPIQYDEEGKVILPNQTIKSSLLESQADIDSKAKNKKIKKFLLIVLAIIVLLVGIFFAYKLIFKKERMTFDKLDKTDSFFLSNKDGYYALFNEDGKQLTEFEFEYVGTFYGGVTRVRHKNGQAGVIKDDGEYLVPLSNSGVYGNYTLFEITNDETYTSQIKNYKGKVIAEGYFLDLESYAYGALFAITKKDENYKQVGSVEIVNYEGISMGALDNLDDYDSYSYDGSYVTLISDEKTILYNIDTAKKIVETDKKYCISDSNEKTVILNSCSTWSSSDEENLYKVVKNGKVLYTVDSTEYYLSLAKDGSVLSRKRYEDYYSLLDDEGNVKQENIIGYQDGKNYVVELDDRLMFYKNGERKNILDCATYYQVASDDLYIIKVDRYADGCKGDVDNQYSYYDLAGNKKSDSYYAAGIFNEAGRAIISTDNLENYVIDENFKVLSGEHYSIRLVGSLYVVWDEKHNQALIGKDGNVLEDEITDYTSYGSIEDDESYIAVEVSKDTYTLYDTQNGKKIVTVSGKSIYLYEHYFTVDGNYYSYKTGKQFYSKN